MEEGRRGRREGKKTRKGIKRGGGGEGRKKIEQDFDAVDKSRHGNMGHQAS